jgi:hypothetical protein
VGAYAGHCRRHRGRPCRWFCDSIRYSSGS